MNSRRYQDYFEVSSDAIIVPMSLLKPSRRRPGGVKNARTYMLLAAAGSHAKRKPLLVLPDGQGAYIISDGNSTYHVLLELGVSECPVIIERLGPESQAVQYSSPSV